MIEIRDTWGDRMEFGVESGEFRLRTPAEVYDLDEERARVLRNALDDFLGEERKESDAAPAPISEERRALLEAGRDLIRRALPDVDPGDFLVFRLND